MSKRKPPPPAAAPPEALALSDVLAVGTLFRRDIGLNGNTIHDGTVVKQVDKLPVGVYRAPLRAPNERTAERP